MITLDRVKSESNCLVLIMQYMRQYLILTLSNCYKNISDDLTVSLIQIPKNIMSKLTVIHAKLHKKDYSK